MILVDGGFVRKTGLRILQVIHQFPPYSSQGSEVYCFNLSKELGKTHDVRVFHLSNAKRRWPKRLSRETFSGLEIYHCIDSAEYSRLATWSNSFLQDSFRKALAEFSPEIVHFHNYLSLSDDLVTLARSGGARVVYTLHDYGLICPNTLLLRTDQILCGKGSPNFFQDCCPVLIRTSRNVSATPWKALLPSLERFRIFASQYPRPILRAGLMSAVRTAEKLIGDPARTDVMEKRQFFLSHTRRIFEDVHLFIAPSRFLRERYVNCGLPEEKILYCRYGIRRFERTSRPVQPGHVRFGYIGALHPHKGIELLLEAFQGTGGNASLHIYGSVFGSPISRNYWRRIQDRADTNITFHGSYENDSVHEILERMDVLVVPSLWYENSPLTIQEAFMSGVPVLTADIGGMAELVKDGIDGIHFRHGDVLDLRSKVAYLSVQPDVIRRLSAGIAQVPSIEKQTEEIRSKYEELVGPEQNSVHDGSRIEGHESDTIHP